MTVDVNWSDLANNAAGQAESPMMLTRWDDMAVECLRHWPGTPEELRDTLLAATKRIDPPGWAAADQERWTREMAVRWAARHRLLRTPGGRNLWIVELQQLREQRSWFWPEW